MSKKILVLFIIVCSSYIYSENEKKVDDFNINLWPLLSYKDNSLGGKDLSALFIFNRKTDSKGEQKELFLFPLFYNFNRDSGNHFGSLLWFGGPDYSIIPPLLSGRWNNKSGGKSTWITPLYHSKTDSEGKIESLHLLNYFYSPGRHILAPLAWNVTTKSGTHHGFIPLYAKGPKYWTVPLGLSLSWENSLGNRTTWITPLFHLSLDREKKLRSFHFLTGYGFRGHRGIHSGIFPLFFKGPDYWYFPAALSFSNTDNALNRRTWITPLFHLTLSREKKFKSFHFLNIYGFKDFKGKHGGLFPIFLKGPDYWYFPPGLSFSNLDDESNRRTWITPLFHLTLDPKKNFKSFHFLNIYAFKDNENRKAHKGLIPLWFSGPNYWVTPPLLAGSYQDDNKVQNTWITPLFHLSIDRDKKVKSFHFLNSYAFRKHKSEKMHKGIVPLWFAGPKYWVVPPALSLSFTHENEDRSTWITPLFHQRRNKDRELQGFHYVNYYGYKTKDGWKKGFAPFWYIGPNYWFSPLLLSGQWKDYKGHNNLWITPLFHRTVDRNGELLSSHLLNYYSFKKDNKIHRSLFPVFFNSSNYWAIPPLLSGGWTDNKGYKTTWITPLFHRSVDRQGELRSTHLLNYYSFKKRNKTHSSLFPIFFKGPNYWVAPPLLSFGWEDDFGGKSLWITPLYHNKKDSNGKLEDFHFLNFIGTKKEKGWEYNLFPIFKKGPDSWCSPILLSGAWTEDNRKNLWLTPLFHLTTDKDKGLQSMHLGPYFNFKKKNHFLFPIAWYIGKDNPEDKAHYGILPLFAGGPDYFISPLGYGFGQKGDFHFGLFPVFAKSPKSLIIPPLLTASWIDREKNRRTWVTPLFHKNSSSLGETTSLHLLNYYYTPDFSTLLPVYFSWKTERGRYSSILPPLIGSFKGDKLTDSLLYQFQPINYQRAGSDYEFNFLWRLFHLKREDSFTEFTLGPLWSSKKSGRGDPMEYQVLGGLFARDVNYILQQLRYRAFWFITLGNWRDY